MDRWEGKVAIVTGASAGIGAAIAQTLSEAGLKVVGLARRKEKVEELANKLKNHRGELHSLHADITKEEDILNAFKWVKENLGPIHILINNAGVGRAATLIDGKTQFWKDVIDTNVLGLCIATREAVKDMKENETNGHIVHINSILGHQILPGSGYNVYSATKYAVTALGETLRQELKAIGSKIKITCISPGPVETSMLQTAYRDSGIETLPDALKMKLELFSWLQPEDVANAVICVLATPSHVAITELIIQPL